MYCERAPEYGLLPGRLPGACGCLGGEVFMGFKVIRAYCTRKWMSGILLRDFDSLCNDFSCTIGNWWSGEESWTWCTYRKHMQVLCSGCERNLKSGTQCDTCGRWYHNRCGSVEAQVAESKKWICDKCKMERLRLIEEKLQEALLQTDDLTRKNKALGEQLQLAAPGRGVSMRETAPDHLKGGEWLVLGDSIVRNVGAECTDMKVECFPSIRMEQLQRVIENRNLGNPGMVVIHVGTNDLRKTGNLDCVMGDIYDLVNMAKTKFATSRVVLSGVLRRPDVSWRLIGAVNTRYEWVAETLGITFVEQIVGWMTGTLLEMAFT